MKERVPFLDLSFDALSARGIENWLAARTAASDFAYVVTPNVDHVVRLPRESQPVRAAYDSAELLLCDSRVLSRLARLVGVRLPVVPGSDLVAALFARVLGAGDRVCLIGGDAGSTAGLAKRFPGIAIQQHIPPMGLRDDPAARAAAVAFAADAGARIILLAVGSPQQELLAHEMATAGTVRGTALCIGASVDFLTGVQTRAPGAIQKAGLEWAWRLASDPRRLARRYLVTGPAIVPMTWRWWRAQRRDAR